MKKITWKKHHKWFGLLFCFFMLMFCLSGIVLNHRNLVGDINVSRRYLPQSYRFKNWNNGLLRGTMPYVGRDSVQSVLLYGNGGIWQTDSLAASFTDFNDGLPAGADYRNMKGVVQMPDGELFAAGLFGLYRCKVLEGGKAAWQEVPLPLEEEGERLSDLTSKGDMLVVVGRSRLYTAVPPYRSFRAHQLNAPEGYDGKVSLFRTVWMLHSGELFGMAGKVLMDGVAIVLILLCLTGVLYWLLPHYIRRIRRAGCNTVRSVRLLKTSLNWHDKVGRTTIVLTLFVSLTGWCLRPPVLIALVQGKVPAVPGTSLDSPNPWHDKLRMMRYDEACGGWLLSTSEGFYALETPDDIPVEVKRTPPVSVMGLNVWQQDGKGRWLCGSFSGMYIWDRLQGTVTDYFTGEPALEKAGAPFGKKAITGYGGDFKKECVAEYNMGTDFAPMPQELAALPMSLWNLCLEIHTGRIYTLLGQGTLIYIFFAGLAAIWCLWSGYVIRKKKGKGTGTAAHS